jgi:hypothetical protein
MTANPPQTCRKDPMSHTDDEPQPEQSVPQTATDIPNPETGVGIGARTEPDTFEPEEDPE